MDRHLLLVITILIGALQFLSASKEYYSKCGYKFQCGNIQNIDYPFWGSTRPNYCGHPSFGLTNCQKNEPPILKINSFPYRVLSINSTSHKIKLVRDDLYDTNCPQQPKNVTLNEDHFSYASDNDGLILYYNCDIPSGVVVGPNKFSCQGSLKQNFYAISGVGLNDGVECETSITVQVELVGDTLSSNLSQVLEPGFGLVWNASNSECDGCVKHGGRCGSDSMSGLFVCYVGGSSSVAKNLRIAIPIASVFVALFGIGLTIFACRKQRKHAKLVESLRSESKDEDPSSSLSKGLTFTTMPSINLSQSIPSYASSKTDFGKSSSYFGLQMFTYMELEEATNNFDSSRELGEGGFGKVYLGKLPDDRLVAVKRLYENNYKRIDQFMNELDILTRLRHENLVTLYGCTSRRSRELLLVYEYIPNGTVADHLHNNRSNNIPKPLSWPIRLNIAIETAGALAYLHESDIIHRDVKTNNILLENDFHVKVADFGISRLFPNDVTHVSTAPQGTPGYVDPEYYQFYQLTEKSDVYSFGVVLIELISGKQAVDTSRERLDINLANMAINRIQNRALNELVDPSLGFENDSLVRRMTTLVAELAFRCLQTERDMRPSMNEVLKTLRGIKEGKLIEQQQAEVLEIVIEDTPVSPRSPASEEQVIFNSTTPRSDG